MNPTQARLTDLLNTDDLNELVPETAAIPSSIIAPEASPENANITVWDETSGADGPHQGIKPAERGKTVAEQLVDAGSDEAGLEQRVASVINTRAKE